MEYISIKEAEVRRSVAKNAFKQDQRRNGSRNKSVQGGIEFEEGENSEISENQ